MTGWYPGEYPSEVPSRPELSQYPGPDGGPAGAIRVWAYRQGIWQAGNGYMQEHIVSASSLDYLVAQLRSKGLDRRIGQLAILAHGDFQGKIAIPAASNGEPPMMSTGTLGSYQTQLAALDKLLAPGADVILFSCITGRGAAGDEFLKALSEKLRGRRIVAFTTIVWYSLFPSTAGQVKDSGEYERALAPRKEADYASRPNLNVESPNAKWAKDGKIIHRPSIDEAAPGTQTTPVGDPIWLNKELWELRCDPGPFMSLKRKLEKQGKYYYVTREDLESCKK